LAFGHLKLFLSESQNCDKELYGLGLRIIYAVVLPAFPDLIRRKSSEENYSALFSEQFFFSLGGLESNGCLFVLENPVRSLPFSMKRGGKAPHDFPAGVVSAQRTSPNGFLLETPFILCMLPFQFRFLTSLFRIL